MVLRKRQVLKLQKNGSRKNKGPKDSPEEKIQKMNTSHMESYLSENDGEEA
ncbi:Hypothetical protein FKW44_009826 [Caligus rogercresseyi]|nr:Hypothetical protein FKW44_021035 [Caligus rogercresseyi]QQP49239.1 Hypothetical protein FKW44_009826 [Caligus rogercresseyi]